MIDHHLYYLYAGAAIAYNEAYDTSPDDTADFVKRVATIPDEISDRTVLVQKALELTGIDATEYDVPGQEPVLRALSTENSRATREDRKAIERMRKTGITQADLEYEKQIGYSNGWNTGFYFSACYATVALALSEHGHGEDVEAFIFRLEELRYEEISASDIIERAAEEAGVDVSGMVKDR